MDVSLTNTSSILSPTLSIQREGSVPPTSSLFERVKAAVEKALSFVKMGFLLVVSPTLFVGAAIFSVLDDERSDRFIEKVQGVFWEKQPWDVRLTLFVAAFAVLPVAVSGFALYEGAKAGQLLRQNIQ